METSDAIAAWARSQTCPALSADLVPGASLSERRSLAALGGIASALVPAGASDTPEAVQAWMEDAPRAPTSLVRRVRSDFDPDLFAHAYSALVAGSNRRRLGTFFTPPSVVTFMLREASDMLSAPTNVIDPGAGVGAFSLAARAHWPSASIIAVDVNIVTLGLLSVADHMTATKPRLHLVHGDYLQWLGEQPAKEGATLHLGNPPYTRHQELDAKTKSAARSAAGDLIDSGLSGLAAYFIAGAISHLSDEDAMCFVLPSTWVQARYGRGIRQWLWESTKRPVRLFAFPSEISIFPGTRVTAMVLAVGAASKRRASLSVRQVEDRQGALRVASIQAVPREGTTPDSFVDLLWPTSGEARQSMTRLGDIARVRRGVATGANAFFFLTDEERAKLPKRATVRAVRRLRHVLTDDLDSAEHDRIGEAGHPRWLLWVGESDDTSGAALSALIEGGKKLGVDQRYLCRVRRTWYALEQIEPPNLLVTTMGQDRLRCVQNVVGAIPSNSMYGIYLNDPSRGTALRDWLNGPAGQAALLEVGRHYSDGLVKLEPRDYLQVAVPDDVAHSAK